MNATVLLNGQPARQLPVTDRGLHYGDGVFRTARVRRGRVCAWPAHYARLTHDCRQLFLPVPDAGLVQQEVQQLFPDRGNGVLKIVVTRGSGGRGYAPPQSAQPTRLLLRYPEPDYSQQRASGVDIAVCRTRLARNRALAGVKHLNRLEQVLARRECAQASNPEGLLLDTDGNVISGTMSNVFMVKNGALYTPSLDHAGVIGATRQRLFALAGAADKRCHEDRLSLSALSAADELFLCNSLIGVWPVTQLADTRLAVGPVTRWCQQQLETQQQG